MKVRTSFASWIEGLRQLAIAINTNADGQSGTVTLTASVASTTLTDTRITASSVITLMPTTANASAEIGAGTIFIGTTAIGSATITHANNAQVDRTFRYDLTS